MSTNVIIFILSTIGLTHIIVDGSIVAPIKMWLQKNESSWVSKKIAEMMNCYQCAGFWCGLLTGIVLWFFSCDPCIFSWWQFPLLILYGFAGSFCSVVGAVLIMFLSSGGEE